MKRLGEEITKRCIVEIVLVFIAINMVAKSAKVVCRGPRTKPVLRLPK